MFGARPQEIATLMHDEVRIDMRGQYWLHIVLPRRPKHDASFRHLLVPQKLMALGFAEYVASVPNGAWLFPCKAADAKPVLRVSKTERRKHLTISTPACAKSWRNG